MKQYLSGRALELLRTRPLESSSGGVGLLGLAALLALSAASCRRSASQLVVHVESNLQAGTELRSLRISVRRVDAAGPLVDRPVALQSPSDLPVELGVLAADSQDHRRVRVEVTSERTDGSDAPSTYAIVGFTPDAVSWLSLVLDSRCVLAARQRCEAMNQVCGAGGQCEDPNRGPLPTVLPDGSVSPPDATSQAEAGDSAPLVEPGPDAALDNGPDNGLDARADVVFDNGPDNIADAALDQGADAGLDAGPRADAEAGADAAFLPTRPLAPLSPSQVTTGRPSLRWLVGATDVAPSSVLLCRDRAMGSGCQTLMVTAGTSVRPASALAAGVWFWRLQGTLGRQPVWQFLVGTRETPEDSSAGATPDFNGDGYADAVVGASGAASSAGVVYVHHGSASGASSAAARSLASPDGMGSLFGAALARAGDLDGDGFGDLVVGSPGASGGSGRVHLFLGSAAGLPATPSVSLSSPGGASGQFGASVAGTGDLDGDGYGDLAVGAPGVSGSAGAVYLFRGGPGGPGAMPSRVLLGTDGSNGRFGVSVAGAGDLNGDGVGDFAAGASGASGTSGRAYVFLGSAAGLAGVSQSAIAPLDGANGGFGAALDGAGDVDGDGFSDLLVAAPGAATGAGRVHLFRGSALGLMASPLSSVTGPDGNNSRFGGAIAGLGDLDGDGFSDVAVGAVGRGGSAGRVHYFRGSSAGLPAAPSASLDGPGGAGGQFGAAVAAAGDLNGDGLADLVVGAPGVMTSAGRVYVYSGAAAGPGAVLPVTLMSADGANAQFGGAVALRTDSWGAWRRAYSDVFPSHWPTPGRPL